jgi:5-methylcytosine-specific restriction endonuclease McrA
MATPKVEPRIKDLRPAVIDGQRVVIKVYESLEEATARVGMKPQPTNFIRVRSAALWRQWRQRPEQSLLGDSAEEEA